MVVLGGGGGPPKRNWVRVFIFLLKMSDFQFIFFFF